MTGGAASVVYGVCDSQTWQACPRSRLVGPFQLRNACRVLGSTVRCLPCRHPDLDWLEQELAGPDPPQRLRLVVA